MTSRYDDKIIFKNQNPHYKNFFKERGVNLIRHFETPIINYPEVSEIATLNTIQHIWAVGDRFYKIAGTYYKNPKYWWVIAWYNQTPTEAHLKLGDLIYIPMPLERALNIFGV
jgi:hypothetical protein